MRKIIFLLTAGLFFINPLAFAEGVAVIINEQSSIFTAGENIGLKEIKDIYLGKIRYRNGSLVKAVNHKDKEILRAFLKKACSMDIDAYLLHWVKFELATGTNAPPVMDNSGEIIHYIKDEKAGIGFAWESQAKGVQGIKVALLLTE